MKWRTIYNLILFLLAAICGRLVQTQLATNEALSPAESNLSRPANLETVTVAQIFDGDTIELSDGRRVRYIGLNTPERGQPFYAEATELNRQLLADQTVQLEFDVEGEDQYGRTLAYVWAGEVLINLEQIRRGYANVLFVPPNGRYATEFRRAEEAARANKLGIWQGQQSDLVINHIEANAPGQDHKNPNGEWVEIINEGTQPVNMQGYTLKDTANNSYQFGEFVLQPGQAVRIYSGRGRDSTTALYWGLVDNSVWNNNGDTAFLRDADGGLVASFSYE